jgi:hypothetical protein
MYTTHPLIVDEVNCYSIGVMPLHVETLKTWREPFTTNRPESKLSWITP